MGPPTDAAHLDIASLPADFATAQDSKFAAFEEKQKEEHKRLRADFKADLAAFISPLDKGYRKRLDRIEMEQADVRAEVRSRRTQREQMSVKVGAFGDTPQQAASATPPSIAIDSDDFHRAPLDTIARVRAQSDTTAPALFDPFKPTLNQMRLDPDAFEWDAQPLGRASTLQFAGAPELARLRVRKFVSLLTDPSGRWQRFQAEAAAGEHFMVYAGIDKNRATIRGETLSRRLSRFLTDKAIGGVFGSRRQDFSVSRDWTPIARIMDMTPDGFRIQWNLGALRDLETHKDVLTHEWLESVDPQDQVSRGRMAPPHHATLGGALRVVTWSANGFARLADCIRRCKLPYLEQLARTVHVALLQEAHTSGASVFMKSLLLRVCFNIGISFLSQDIFGVRDDAIRAVCEEVASAASCRPPPVALADVFGSDFNLVDGHDRVFHTRSGDPRLERTGRRRRQREWQHIVRSAIEISIDDDTYLSLAVGSYSRLDKTFVRPPSWALTSLRAQGPAVDDPVDLRSRGIDDRRVMHAPCDTGRVAPHPD